MASLDQNLVTAQWSILGVFGVAITLLLPKAESFRRDYLAVGEKADFDDARRWYLIVTTVPIAVLVGLLGLSLIGAHHAGLSFTSGQPSQDTVLLVAPLLAQLGFILIVFYMLSPVPAVRTISLMSAKDQLASSFSDMPSSICVVNTSDGDLDVCWINQLGHPESPGSPRSVRVSRGGSRELPTYARHAWLISTSGGAQIGVIVAAETPGRVNVNTEIVDQGLSSQIKLGKWRPAPEPLPPSDKSLSQSLIAIENRTEEPVAIEWLDFDGQPSLRDVIPLGTVHSRNASSGHHFLVSTLDGARVGMATATGTPHVFIVTSENLKHARRAGSGSI